MFENHATKVSLMLLIIACAVASATAAEVGALTSFSPGTTAKASEVNGNFSAIKTAVDANAADISVSIDDIAENAIAIEAIGVTGADIGIHEGTTNEEPCSNVPSAPTDKLCLTMTLDAPSDGFVLLILSAEAVTFGGGTVLQLDIYNQDTAMLLATAKGGRLDDDINMDGVILDRAIISLTRQVITAVQQGANTFSVRASKEYDAHTVNVARAELSGIFFKQQL